MTPDPEIIRQLARGPNGGAWADRVLMGCQDFPEIVLPMPAVAQPWVVGGALPIFWIKGEVWT